MTWICFDPEQLLEAIVGAIGLDLQVTISGVTQPLTFWRYPEHWAEDWKRELGLDSIDDVPEAVEALIAAAIERA